MLRSDNLNEVSSRTNVGLGVRRSNATFLPGFAVGHGRVVFGSVLGLCMVFEQVRNIELFCEEVELLRWNPNPSAKEVRWERGDAEVAFAGQGARGA
jgi:hypothetical protein